MGVLSIIETAAALPVDVLQWHELTAGSSVGGYQHWTNEDAQALRIVFDSPPAGWGYYGSSLHWYIPALALVAFAWGGYIYAMLEVHWGDFQLWPLPPGPLAAVNVDLAVEFLPGIQGRVYKGSAT